MRWRLKKKRDFEYTHALWITNWKKSRVQSALSDAGYLVSLNNISFEFHDIYKWQDCIFQFQQYITCHKYDASNIIGLFIQVSSYPFLSRTYINISDIHFGLIIHFEVWSLAWWEKTVKIHNFFAAQVVIKA